MKENKYDDPKFFEAYGKMDRSEGGLEAAGEWHELQRSLPDFRGKRVLDLGCGYGWHCRYAVENGAESVVGIDISAKMVEKAKSFTSDRRIQYRQTAIEDFGAPAASFDVVLSSLAFHYLADFAPVCRQVARLLVPGGSFVFSAEHPIFTAVAAQDWIYDQVGNKLHWPVDGYSDESVRLTNFLGERVTKYHRTLATYVTDLLAAGFSIASMSEPAPDTENARRPMMLILGAVKN